MVKSYEVGGWWWPVRLYCQLVSYLGQVIVIVIGRPRSLTIILFGTLVCLTGQLFNVFIN